MATKKKVRPTKSRVKSAVPAVFNRYADAIGAVNALASRGGKETPDGPRLLLSQTAHWCIRMLADPDLHPSNAEQIERMVAAAHNENRPRSQRIRDARRIVAECGVEYLACDKRTGERFAVLDTVAVRLYGLDRAFGALLALESRVLLEEQFAKFCSSRPRKGQRTAEKILAHLMVEFGAFEIPAATLASRNPRRDELIENVFGEIKKAVRRADD